MGFFNKDKPVTASAALRVLNSLSGCEMMERVRIDLNRLTNSNTDSGPYCKIVAESQNYYFYCLSKNKDNSDGYYIRRRKSNPDETVYFGESSQLACVFNSFLIHCDRSGESGSFYIFAKSIESGVTVQCDWLGKGSYSTVSNGVSHMFAQDRITDMCVVNDRLVFHIHRHKSDNADPNDKYDVDCDYVLKVNLVNNRFFKSAEFPFDSKSQNKYDNSGNGPVSEKSPSIPQKGLGRDKSKHIACEYEGHEDNCPKECSKCAISIKTDGDVALASNQLDEAIKQYKRAVFVEPKFAEAWCNLGNAFGMKSEYNNALAAFDKALAIDPKYGKAMYGKAITLRNLDRLDKALELTNEILDVYDETEVRKFRSRLLEAGAKDIKSNNDVTAITITKIPDCANHYGEFVKLCIDGLRAEGYDKCDSEQQPLTELKFWNGRGYLVIDVDPISPISVQEYGNNLFIYGILRRTLSSNDLLMCACIELSKKNKEIIVNRLQSLGLYEYYLLDDGSISVFGFCSKPIENAIIPEKIDGRIVSEISGNAFAECETIKSVVIPKTVKKVHGAFSGCKEVEHITIGENVEELTCSFIGCDHLEKIYIGPNVRKLSSSFYLCERLTDIKVDLDNEWFCDVDGVLFSKDKTVLLLFPGGRKGKYIIPFGTRIIGSEAFRMTGVEEIEMPNTVEKIGSDAFTWMKNLKKINIPSSVNDLSYRSISSDFFGFNGTIITEEGSYAHTCIQEDYDANGKFKPMFGDKD